MLAQIGEVNTFPIVADHTILADSNPYSMTFPPNG